MPATLSNGLSGLDIVPLGLLADGRSGSRVGAPPPFSGLARGAVARRDVLLLGVLGRGGLDQRPQQGPVGLDPVGDDDPLVAVPLLELHRPAALVVGAGALERLHQAAGPEL